MSSNLKCYKGFTLVELSIVLVIIGLVIGGVLVGRDLIKSSEIRKSISTLEQVATSVNTFRIKYNCIPGDCVYTTSLFTDLSFNGNGNGLVDNWSSESLATVDSLRSSKLLSQNITEVTSGTALYDGTHYIRGHNNSWSYFYYADLYSVGGGSITVSVPAVLDPAKRTGMTLTWAKWVNSTGCFNGETVSPLDAGNIDQKIDDGLPKTGSFIAFDAKDVAGTCTGYTSRCWVTGQNSYKTSDNVGCRVIYYLPAK